MKKVRLEEYSMLSDMRFDDDVEIVMDLHTVVTGCVFKGNVVLEGTRRVMKVKLTIYAWKALPVFINNIIYGNLEVKKSFKGVVRDNIVLPTEVAK